MAGTSSLINSCQHKKLKQAKRPNFQKCGACRDFIYAGARSAKYCKDCEEHFHDFCVENPAEVVNFKFAGGGGQIKLFRTQVESTAQQERCEACEDPLRGLTRYSNGKYSVHPECAVNLVSGQINKEGSNSGVAMHRALPTEAQRVVNCMLCQKVRNYKWSYVITEGTAKSGCHLHCLREQLIIDDDQRNKHKDVNLKKYFETVGTPNVGIEKFIRWVARILTAAAGLAPPPVNGLIALGAKNVEDKAVRKLYNY